MEKIKGFTLVELLVVISIIGFLATLAVTSLGSGRLKARDARRIANIKQIQTALELYFSDANDYPTGVTAGNTISYSGTVYMKIVPSNSTPTNDGNCGASVYSYIRDSASSYRLTFCLGGPTGGFTAGGTRTATPVGLQ